MIRLVRRGSAAALSLLALLALPRAVLSQAVRWISAPMEIRVPKAPTVVAVNGGSVLPYELHITNWATQPFLLKRIEVVGAGSDSRIYLALSDSALGRSIGRPGFAPNTSAERMRLGEIGRAHV